MLKLLIEIDLGKPLLRGSNIKLETELVWVDFQYENLPNFYFYCGVVGHSERECAKKMEDSRNNVIYERQYGSWLRGQAAKRGKQEAPKEVKLVET